MIRRKIGHLLAASAFVFAFSLTGAMAAFAAETPTPGSDLAADIQTAQAGEKATANDVDTAEEVNVDDGQVEAVDESVNGPETSTSTGSN